MTDRIRNRFQMMHGALPPRRQEQFLEGMEEVLAGVEAGEIQNARFNNAREMFGRLAEIAYRQVFVDPFLYNREYRSQLPEEQRNLLEDMDGYVQTNTAPKMLRQAAALGACAAGEAGRAVLQEINDGYRLLKQAKAVAVKRRPAAPAPSAREIYSAPAASRTAMGEVSRILNELASESRTELVRIFSEAGITKLNRFLSKQDEMLAAGKAFSPRRYFARGNSVDAAQVQELSRLIQRRTGGGQGYERHPDAIARNREQAEKSADAYNDAFVEKTLSKLAPIIEGRGNFKEIVEIARGISLKSMSARLRVIFEDGANFEARCQMVWSYTHQGTTYCRYPLTFHDVTLADGSRMKQPSEKSMNEEFARNRDASPAPG